MSKQLKLCGLVLLLGLTLPGMVLATNGYFSHGYSTKNKGMGGAGTALPLDSMAAANNPAGLTEVDSRFDAGGAYFNPNRSYAYTGPSPFFTNPTQTSGSDSFIIPHFGYNRAMGGDSALGLALYGRGGMNTDYPLPVYANGNGATGVNLEQLFVNFSYAKKFGGISAGGSLLYVRQTFEAKGLQGFDNAFYSANPGKVTNNGEDTSTGFGLALGVLAELGDSLKFGASYTPSIDMSEFAQYSGLFAEKGNFDIPSTYTVGVAFETGDLTIAADYQAINYTDVPAVSNSLELALPGPTPPAGRKLGEDNGLGFGWTDITVIKLGASYRLSETLAVRGGVNRGENPIPKSEGFFNVLAPGVIEDHVTLGATWAMSQTSELSFAFMRALENNFEADIPALAGGGTVALKMDQNELEVSFGMKL